MKGTSIYDRVGPGVGIKIRHAIRLGKAIEAAYGKDCTFVVLVPRTAEEEVIATMASHALHQEVNVHLSVSGLPNLPTWTVAGGW